MCEPGALARRLRRPACAVAARRAKVASTTTELSRPSCAIATVAGWASSRRIAVRSAASRPPSGIRARNAGEDSATAAMRASVASFAAGSSHV
jgi:hypothetical protein